MFSSENPQFCNKSASPIRKLPVEVLTTIFLFVGPPSTEKPFVYFILSWVCQQWRSILLENPNFWTVIRPKLYSNRHINHNLLREVIRRSKSHQLDIFTCDCDYDPDGNLCFVHYMISECSRIRSLYFRNCYLFEDYSEQCPESFPHLENLIFDEDIDHYSESVHQILLACRPRFVQFFSEMLVHERMSPNPGLAHVEWLKFIYTEYTEPDMLPVFYRVLEHLPNLKILNIISRPRSVHQQMRPWVLPPLYVVTLPNLRMLSLDMWRDGFHSIHAPALDYVDLSNISSYETSGWNILDSFDLSMTKSFCIKFYQAQWYPDPTLTKLNNTGVAKSSIACITTGDSVETCQLIKKFREPVSPCQSSVDSQLVLPPKNAFHIELHMSQDLGILPNYLKRAINLVELILDYQSFKTGEDGDAMVSKMLETLDTITHLNVLRCRSFSLICDILTRQRNVPRLERLTYHSSRKPVNAYFVPGRLEMMQNARLGFHCEPLKILELRDFLVISPQQIEKIEGLGIQLIQSVMKIDKKTKDGVYVYPSYRGWHL